MNTYFPKSSTISSPGLEPELRPSARSITSHTNQRLSKALLDTQKAPEVHNSTFISEKEMRLDKQFQDLVKRCNQSKAEIEKLNKTLFTERLNISPKFEKSKDFSLQPVSAYSMILSPAGKINFKDSASNKSTSHFESFQPHKKEEDLSFLKTGRSNLNAKQPSFSIVATKGKSNMLGRSRNIGKRDSDDEDSLEEDGMHTAENLKELKSALDEQKRVDEGQLRNLENQYDEIKQNLKKYLSKVDELEDLHKKKDKQLRRLDEQLARKTKDLTKKEGILRECEQMKGVLRENSDDLESLNVEYSIRLAQQGKTLSQLEQVFEREKENHLKEARKARDENRSLRREIDLLRARENILIESNKSLKEDIDELKPKLTSTSTASHQLEKAESSAENQHKLLSQQYGELTLQNKSLKQQLEELEALVEANGDRLVEISLRSKEEKRRLKEEGAHELVRKKEQINDLKREIRECEHAAVKTKEESRIVDREIQAAREQKSGLERERDIVRNTLSQLEQEKKLVRENIEKLRSQNGELQESKDKETAKIQKLTEESNKVHTVLESLEAKVGYREKILREAEDNYKALKEDKELLFRSNDRMREDLGKLRNREEIAKVSHKDDATLTEKKVNGLYDELKKAADDNTAVGKIVETLRKELLEVKNQRAEDEREFMELKEQNKFLKNCIAQSQEELEIAIQQRRERVEKKMREEQERANAGEKIRILNEIQGKIDRFRVVRKYSDSD